MTAPKFVRIPRAKKVGDFVRHSGDGVIVRQMCPGAGLRERTKKLRNWRMGEVVRVDHWREAYITTGPLPASLKHHNQPSRKSKVEPNWYYPVVPYAWLSPAGKAERGHYLAAQRKVSEIERKAWCEPEHRAKRKAFENRALAKYRVEYLHELPTFVTEQVYTYLRLLGQRFERKMGLQEWEAKVTFHKYRYIQYAEKALARGKVWE